MTVPFLSPEWDQAEIVVAILRPESGINGGVETLGRLGAAIDSIVVLPIPAVAWMFPVGLLAGFGWMKRRSTANV